MKRAAAERAKAAGKAKAGPRLFVFGAAIVIVAGGIVGLSLSVAGTDDGPATDSAAPGAATASRPTNQPPPPPGVNLQDPSTWQYDAANDRYWDPTEGHNHWHKGKPPGPWSYRAEGNQHWDPRPGHQHWHQGQPPPPDQRQ